MIIILETSSQPSVLTEDNTATLGRDASCALSMPQDDRIEPHHATIKKVAGRWLIESAGDWLIRVGDGPAGRKRWLKPGDVIHLTETGPEITFNLAEGNAPAPGGLSHIPPRISDSVLACDRGEDENLPLPQQSSGSADADRLPPHGRDDKSHSSRPARPQTEVTARGSGMVRSWTPRLRNALISAKVMGKAAAIVVAKNTERRKITSITLPKAYAALGRDIHARNAYRDDFADVYLHLQAHYARVEQAEARLKERSKGNTLAEKAKLVGKVAKDKAEIQFSRLQIARLMTTLGESAFARHGNQSGPPEVVSHIEILIARATRFST
jgi:hypothetical protein